MGHSTPRLDAAIVLDVLVLEDSDEDALLLARALRNTGYAHSLRRARNRSEFALALDTPPDLVLSDFHLPDFDALGALDLLRERGIEAPLILVSGLARDEEVLEAMRRGAADFLSKDRMVRLGPAIASTLEQRALRQQARDIQQAQEQERAALEARFRATFEQAAVGIAHTTPEGAILSANRKLCEIFGYSERELRSLTTRDLTHPEDRDRQDELRRELLAGRRASFSGEKRGMRADGATVWVNRTVTLARPAAGGAPYLIQVFEDITERKRIEESLRRLTRARRVMAECSCILVHSDSETKMLEDMCRVLVGSGGYRMAWVGLATGDSLRPLYPAAHAGYEGDAPMTGSVAWSADGRYQGFMSSVMASGSLLVERDILKDPAHAGRVARALRHGFQSRIALPLKGDGRLLGAVAIYAVEPDAFDQDEIALLEELADDIAFGLLSLRERVARRNAEAALNESERKFRETFEQAAVGITRVDLDGRLIDVNQKFCDMLGYARDELLGRHVREITHPEDYGKGARSRTELTRSALASVTGEKRFLRKDGTILWARRTMSAARSASGEPLYVISVVEDITERKALERRFQDTFEQAAVGIVHVGLDGRYLRVNRKLCEITGYTEEDLIGPAQRRLSHPDDLGSGGADRRRLLAGEITSHSNEKRYVRKDGRVIWVNRTESVARDEAGRPLYFIRVIEDITARKEAEERDRATFDAAPVGIMHHDLERRILQVNPRLCEILGYDVQDLVGRPVDDLIAPEHRGTDRHIYLDDLLSGRRRSYASERMYLRKDGSTVWVNRTISLVRDSFGQPRYFVRIVEDISARKRIEQQFRDTFEQAAMGIAHVDFDNRYLRVNRKFCEITGYDESELVGQSASKVSHAEDVGSGESERARLLSGEIASFSNEKRYVRRDGRLIWVRCTESVARDAGGRPLYCIRVIEDITPQRELERRFELIFNHAAVGIAVTGLDGRVIEVNRTFAGLLGYAREELQGRLSVTLTHPDDVSEMLAARRELLEGRVASASIEKRLMHRDGTAIWVNRTASVLRDAAGEPLCFVTLFEDITARKRVERELQRKTEMAQLLESLARAASEAASPEAAMRVCLERICEHGKWAIGRVGIYRAGEVGPFPEAVLWHPRDPAGYEPFVHASTEAGAYPSQGQFISVVLRERRAMWLADLTRVPRTGRLLVAERCGLRSAFAFPVIVEGQVAAFLEFFSTEVREPDALLMEAAGSVAAQLARLVERDRAAAVTARLAAIVESSQDAMISIRLDGTILTWNRGAERLFGYAAGEAVGCNVSMLFPEELRHEIGETRAAVASGAPVEARDSVRLGKDGRRVQVAISASALRDGGGELAGIALIYRDISERKRAEEAIAAERTLLRTLVDAVPDRIYVKDREGRFLLQNLANARAHGAASPEELLGKTVFDVMPREMAERIAAEDRTILETGEPVLDRERMSVGRDGNPRWVVSEKIPLRDARGEITGIVGVNRDITERKLAERRREMEHDVTRILAEADTVEAAMPRLIRAMCEAMGWAYGARWFWSDTQRTLVRAEHWSDFALEPAGEDALAWTRLRYDSPGGLLRSAWSRKEPTWIEDIGREPSFNRARAALECGLRSAFSFPVIVGTQVIGIMEFFGKQVRKPDGTMLQMSGSIGRQIGQFIRRKQAEEALRQSEERYRDLFEASPQPMWLWDDASLAFIAVNEAAVAHYGYSREEFLRMKVCDLWFPGEEERYERDLDGRAREQTLFMRRRHRTRGGRVIDVDVTARLLTHDGRAVWLTLVNDVTERLRAERALRESEEQFRQLANNIPQAFWIVDAEQKRTLYISPAAQAMLGQPLETLLSRPRALVRAVHRDDRRRVHAARRGAADGGYDQTYRVVRPDGSIRWVHDRAFPVHDDQGRVYRVAGIAEDVTERREAEQRLMELAHYDVLTRLPNRVLFYDRLRQALAQAKRNGWNVGVVFIDVDRFKNVNDTLGHAVGDRLLQLVSERLAGSVRSGDTVGRLGGDEFAIVLSGLNSAQDASLVVQKLMAAFDAPFRLDGAELYVTISIGVTLYPDDSADQDTLIRNADTAMYRAKEAGRNNYQFYTPEMNARALEVLEMEASLRRALERGEFLLHFQPKASASTGEITGVEALLRWRHPERGLVPPGEFIPLLEETGLIVAVGDWVIRAACAQVGAWRDAGIAPVPVAVNLSARQFQSQGFGERIVAAIGASGIEPRLIELEITESLLMQNPERAVAVLQYLKSHGLSVSVDDFGTGYSSLGYLKRFPLDALKIDRSFVRDIDADLDNATITRAVISMAHSLGLRVIAEGVETASQLEFLAEYGCDEIQGYFFSRPLAAETCGEWLRERRRLERVTQAPAESARTVLLVDDDEDALVLLRRALSRDGYRIVTARNAHEALDALGRHRVDVVISDQSMPGVPGLEFLRRVQRLHPLTVRMMTSGYADDASVRAALDSGEIFRFLPKGATEERLRGDVREAMRAREQAIESARRVTARPAG